MRDPAVAESTAETVDSLFEGQSSFYELSLRIKREHPDIAIQIKKDLKSKYALRKDFVKVLTRQRQVQTQRTIAKSLNAKFNVKRYILLESKEHFVDKLHNKMFDTLLDMRTFDEVNEICKEYIERKDEISRAIEYLLIFGVAGVMDAIKLLSRPFAFKRNKPLVKSFIMDYMSAYFGHQR
eukprot:TRINITY_DN16459_c0_g2_i2.p2 TRINITY_DN16459_c0_g2~~TRINITY_DN16459_c0_g2_i2.p2  ORF type:complete len:181 (-),score=43.68 TRINITY_DN16459_c0_g2_i2:527-1069(-)